MPHWNAHGRAQSGTYHDGTRERCRGSYTDWSSYLNWCVQIQWADGMFPYNPAPNAAESWHGTLLMEKRDASGLLYRRNRYYDPATGRFTQEDPIGLAGGVNVYGFANGDPVTYSDPYGLKVECLNQAGCDAYNELVARVNAGLRSDDKRVRAGARRLAAVMNAAMNDQEITYLVSASDFNERAEERTHGGQETYRGGGVYLLQVDTRPTSDQGYVQMPTWMLMAHELGGARSRSLGNGHNRGAIRAENGARMLVGCSKRWNHKWDNNLAYPPCSP
jgi:RHS repeat-associated protein